MSTGQVVGERWKLGKTLGRGSFATVKQGMDITGQMRETVAVKIFQEVDDELDMLDIEQEIRIMKGLDNEHCLALYDVVVEEDSGSIFVVMELAHMELTTRMEDSASGRLSEGAAREYLRQLMQGLTYLHGKNIIHRDIKFENVMLDKRDRVKIGDFGMSKVSAPGKHLATRCGSTRYISPEMALMQPGDTYDGRAMDVWSSGVLLFAMITGTLPFPQEALGDMLKAITRGAYKIPSFVSSDAHDLISKMLAIDYKDRYTLDQIKQHPWLQTAKAPARPRKIENMRSMDSEQRKAQHEAELRKAKEREQRKAAERGGGTRRRGSRRTSNHRNVMRGRKSPRTEVDGVVTTADMVRTLFALFKRHYKSKVDWAAIKADPDFTGRFLDLLGDMENVRMERMSDAEWKVRPPPHLGHCVRLSCPVSGWLAGCSA
jgi:5'-AMP-activated protein kinase catalytic alpha subunit